MTPGAAQSLLRDIIATYNFDEIFKLVDKAKEGSEGFDPDQRTIKEIENEIVKRLSAGAPERGVHARWVDIREIRIREDVLGKVLDWWGTEWEKRIAIKEAEGEREATIVRADGERIALLRSAEAEARALTALEKVKAEARKEMIRQIVNALSQVDKDMALRFTRLMEQLSCDMVTDSISARRYIEVLEVLAKSEGQKTIIIGGDRQLLWPRRRTGGALEESTDDEG
jgi:regulator of protease activity HflC (stomatin/prohibitin superfamily)